MHSTHRKGMDKRVERTIHKKLEKGLPVEERYNCIYNRKDILEPMIYSISRGHFLEGGVEALKENRKGVPYADSISYRLRKMRKEDALSYFHTVNVLQEDVGGSSSPSSLAVGGQKSIIAQDWSSLSYEWILFGYRDTTQSLSISSEEEPLFIQYPTHFYDEIWPIPTRDDHFRNYFA